MNNKELRVTDDFRSNDLSLEEGGETIKIIMKNGKILIYDKIKSVTNSLESENNYISLVVDENNNIIKSKVEYENAILNKQKLKIIFNDGYINI